MKVLLFLFAAIALFGAFFERRDFMRCVGFVLFSSLMIVLALLA